MTAKELAEKISHWANCEDKPNFLKDVESLLSAALDEAFALGLEKGQSFPKQGETTCFHLGIEEAKAAAYREGYDKGIETIPDIYKKGLTDGMCNKALEFPKYVEAIQKTIYAECAKIVESEMFANGSVACNDAVLRIADKIRQKAEELGK